MKGLIFCLLAALALWTWMFIPLDFARPSFWAMMTCSAITLTTLATIFERRWWRLFRFHFSDIFLGIGIAAVLWGVFWIGDKLSQLMFDFSRAQVNDIYGIKGDTPGWLISLLLLLIIGPAEEIFWRGYIQRRLSAKFSPNTGFIFATAAYTLVHVPSCNFMLIMASMVCGIAWGGLFRFFPNRFGAIILSHAIWDAAVFVWFPI